MTSEQLADITAPIFIGGTWVPADGERFAVDSPLDQQTLGSYRSSSWSQLDQALNEATNAARRLEVVEPEFLAISLDQIALAIERTREELAELAHQETGLPVSPRLLDVEIPGTVHQLRQAAEAARSRSWKLPTISPQARIASQFVPINGVVVVLGPNNFPFRFNAVGGGDFAAALASGHPVLAKAHPLHPGTTRRLMELVVEAVVSAGLPPGTVQLVYEVDPVDGHRLVADRRVAATAFTGSQRAGLALKAAAERAGKPIYLEMSSLNPVVVLPQAAMTRGESIGLELGNSVTTGMGQFCTCPNLVLVTAAEIEPVRSGLTKAIEGAPVHSMLGLGVAKSFRAVVDTLVAHGATVLATGSQPSGAGHCPVVLEVHASQLLDRPDVFTAEAFGPSTLLVICEDVDELLLCIQGLPGSLAGSIYSDTLGRDDDTYDRVELLLRHKVGRVLNDKVPTGVSLEAATIHGGPFPATGHPGFTSVGMPASLRRFGMLQCYDNVRDDRLPHELQGGNPANIQRFVNGEWTADEVEWG